MNSLVNQAKAPLSEVGKCSAGEKDKSNHAPEGNRPYEGNMNVAVKETLNLGFVKVSVDGIPIGRKVDLSAHSRYETLVQAVEEMFFGSTNSIGKLKSHSYLQYSFVGKHCIFSALI